MLKYLASIFILANIVTINSAAFLEDKVCADCKFVGVEVKGGIDFKSLAQVPLQNSTDHDNRSSDFYDQVLANSPSLIASGLAQLLDFDGIVKKAETELNARNISLCSLCKEYHLDPKGKKSKIAIEVFQSNVCPRLAVLEQTCRDLSEKHPTTILGYLFDKTDNCSNFCQKNASLKSEVNDVISSLKLSPQITNMFKFEKIVKRDIMDKRLKNDTPLCEACTKIVTEIRQFVNQNLTTQQIIDQVENICDNIPFFSKVCKAFIETDVPIIIDLINKNVDPNTICQGYCNKTKTVPNIKYLAVVDYTRTHQKIDPSQLCQICLDLVSKLGGLNATMICAPFCNGNRKALQYLKHSKELSTHNFKNDTQLCEVCTQIVSEIRGFVNQNLTAQQIIDSVEGICNQIPFVGPICKVFIETEVPIIIDLVNKNVDPNIICQRVCNQTRTVQNIRFMVVLESTKSRQKIDPSELCHKCMDIMSKIWGFNATLVCVPFCNVTRELLPYLMNNEVFPVQNVKNDTQLCEVCTNLVSEVRDFVTQNLTAQQIIDLVENVCNQIPFIGKVCKIFIETEVPIIIDLIKKSADPNIICLGVCNKKRLENTVSLLSFLDSSRTSQLQCDVCVFNAELTRMTMKQHPTDRHQQIQKLFEQIRKIFPTNLRNKWFSYLNENDDAFVELLKNNVDSQTACRYIKQCYGKASAKYVAQYDSI